MNNRKRYAKHRNFEYPDECSVISNSNSIQMDSCITSIKGAVNSSFFSCCNPSDPYAELAEYCIQMGNIEEAMLNLAKSITITKNIQSLKRLGEILLEGSIIESKNSGLSKATLKLGQGGVNFLVIYAKLTGNIENISKHLEDFATILNDSDIFNNMLEEAQRKAESFDYNTITDFFHYVR